MRDGDLAGRVPDTLTQSEPWLVDDWGGVCCCCHHGNVCAETEMNPTARGQRSGVEGRMGVTTAVNITCRKHRQLVSRSSPKKQGAPKHVNIVKKSSVQLQKHLQESCGYFFNQTIFLEISLKYCSILFYDIPQVWSPPWHLEHEWHEMVILFFFGFCEAKIWKKKKKNHFIFIKMK